MLQSLEVKQWPVLRRLLVGVIVVLVILAALGGGGTAVDILNVLVAVFQKAQK